MILALGGEVKIKMHPEMRINDFSKKDIQKTVFAIYLAFGYTSQSLPGNVPGGLSAPGGDRAVSGGNPEERRYVTHARI